MGRELRMVPANWEHPRDEHGYIPLMPGEWFASVHKEWLESDQDYNEPTADEFMPNWATEQRTHFMMYEDTSEGTPLSPAFATAEELARWLADTNASAFADMTATYDQWLRTINRGFAVSMVIENGVTRSGVEDS